MTKKPSGKTSPSKPSGAKGPASNKEVDPNDKLRLGVTGLNFSATTENPTGNKPPNKPGGAEEKKTVNKEENTSDKLGLGVNGLKF